MSSRSIQRKKSKGNDHFEQRVQSYTLVAALIATVTFAATFTVPGGYDQQTGIAILVKQAVFKAFVISNTISMCSALVVAFCFIWAWRDPEPMQLNQLLYFHRLTVIALLSLIVAVIAAIYLVVEAQSRWLAVVVILIGWGTPVLVWHILGSDLLLTPL